MLDEDEAWRTNYLMKVLAASCRQNGVTLWFMKRADERPFCSAGKMPAAR
jgi:hypothetical protein